MEDNSYRLIVEYFEKTISDDGLTQLQEWIEENPENLAQFSETIQILEASKTYFKQPEHTENSWARINAHITQSQISVKERGPKFNWIAYAVACVLICTSGWFGYFYFKQSPASVYEEISNADGKHSKIQLPDSSVVYLGGGSKLKYAKNFDGEKRDVMLDGEAFFDVVHKAKPFVVKSGDITTVVLGTSFNIKAYLAEHKVAVTVQSGKVGVMANGQGKPQMVKYLVKNEEISINTQNGIYTFNNIDASAVSSWINNEFVFYNTTYNEIAASLQHHYGVKIRFTEQDLGNVKLTAKLKGMTLTDAMETLSALSGLGYTQKGDQLFISNNNQKGGSIMK
ncbi:FecR family protein [Mucilaginibacter sp. cycad4]|uniref:FecR family protein n=1 Tax=Mucilaginibacter sp. cycad4 TaxID=3342096 RepID=UPI002AAC0B7D|nr:FecR family protein [Mucilaginibacter gossypii]WPV00851.1 FecR family protein [Mucilaginibacter gossypii]